MHKDTPYKSDDNCYKVFDKLKHRLVIALILIYSNYKEEFILATDASYDRFGATLSQITSDNKEHPIAYISKSLKKEEINYSATELEYAAIVWAIEYFYKYLGTRHFTLITDHSALQWLKSSQPKGRLGWWMMKLQPYNYTIYYKLGWIYSNVNALSRLPNQIHPTPILKSWI